MPVIPEEDGLDLTGPALSAIVISRNDEDRIERVVRAVVEQECPEPFEVVVVVSGTDRTAAIVRERFPEVQLIELGPGRALPGRARNAGLRVARGEFISFPGSHVELPQGSLAARMRAHQLGYSMVTGTTLNGTPTRSGWASYFLDHSTVLPSRPSGRLSGPPAHCSYIRDHLVAAGGFPEDMRAGEDTVVNVELTRRGLTAYRAREVTIVHRSRCTNPARLVRHHFQRGRGLGRILLDRHRSGGRLLARAGAPYGVRYLRTRLGAIRRNVQAWGGELRPHYRRARPLIAAGALAALVGTWTEILLPARGKWAILAGPGEPGRVPAAAGSGRAAERFPAEIEVNAYVLPSAVARRDDHAAELASAAEGLTYVTPFSHRALGDGSIVSPDDSAARSLGELGGAVPLLALTNSAADGSFDTEAATALLASHGAQRRLLDRVERLCEERGYRGVNVDFERLRPADRQAFEAFLRAAAERLHGGDRLLVTALAPKRYAAQTGIWHGAHDYRAHGELADRVVLMAYEWSRKDGPPASVAPLDAVRGVLRHAVDEIPREKILLGIPLYGYDWTLGAAQSVPARRLGLLEARLLAEAHGARVEYDAARESPSFRYSDGAGEHVVWFEDERSLAAKLDLARAYGVRGVSLWRLPDPGGEAMTLLQDRFVVSQLREAAVVSAA